MQHWGWKGLKKRFNSLICLGISGTGGFKAHFRPLYAALFWMLWGVHFQNTCMHVPGLIIFCDSLNVFLLTFRDFNGKSSTVSWTHGLMDAVLRRTVLLPTLDMCLDRWQGIMTFASLCFTLLKMCLCNSVAFCSHKRRLVSNLPADLLLLRNFWPEGSTIDNRIGITRTWIS